LTANIIIATKRKKVACSIFMEFSPSHNVLS